MSVAPHHGGVQIQGVFWSYVGLAVFHQRFRSLILFKSCCPAKRECLPFWWESFEQNLASIICWQHSAAVSEIIPSQLESDDVFIGSFSGINSEADDRFHGPLFTLSFGFGESILQSFPTTLNRNGGRLKEHCSNQ